MVPTIVIERSHGLMMRAPGNRDCVALTDHAIPVEKGHLTFSKGRIQAAPMLTGDRVLQHKRRPDPFHQFVQGIGQLGLLLEGDEFWIIRC